MARLYGFIEASDHDIVEAASEIDEEWRARMDREQEEWMALWDGRKQRLQEQLVSLKEERSALIRERARLLEEITDLKMGRE